MDVQPHAMIGKRLYHFLQQPKTWRFFKIVSTISTGLPGSSNQIPKAAGTENFLHKLNHTVERTAAETDEETLITPINHKL